MGVQMRSLQNQLLDSISVAFPAGVVRTKRSLRQGNELDSHDLPTPDVFPADWREVTDQQLEVHHWGFNHLDASSWHFYLPAFLSYSVRHLSRGDSLAVLACLNNLRPPDRVPSRFDTLTDRQRELVIGVLEFLAFDPESQFSEDACQVLEEFWIERPLYPNAQD
jgi:hypothetical protein